MNKHIQKHHLNLLLSIPSLFIFLLVILSPVDRTGSDPKGSLLLSQNLIENQTLKFDQYASTQIINLDCNKISSQKAEKFRTDICEYPRSRLKLLVNTKEIYPVTAYKTNGHLYYYFPIGTSISSIPFVLFGMKVLNANMEESQEDTKYQKIIAGIVSVIIFVTLTYIAKIYFDSKLSIGIALIFWLGTSLSSTLGQALWAQGFSTLYALLALYLMLQILEFNKDSYWALLAVVLFMAYLTRPTLSLLSMTVILCIFCKNKIYIAVKIVALMSIFLGGFVLFSIFEFNQPLPIYYMPINMANMPERIESNTFWVAFVGNLVSPSRGFFVFSPFLLLFLINIKKSYHILIKDKAVIIIIGWGLCHLIIISKFTHWWGGFSYGSRFMMDIIPGVYIIFLILVSSLLYQKTLYSYQINLLFLMITIPLSFYFNTVQGLYNQYSGLIWNTDPNIDKYPEYIFDWKYPQFLHNKERHNARLIDFKIKSLASIPIETTTPFNSKNVVYIGWSSPEKNYRWSLDKSSKLLFKLANFKHLSGILKLHIGTLGEQIINVTLNNYPLETQTVNTHDTVLQFQFPAYILKQKKLNTISFKFPNAHRANNGDSRILAIALKQFTLE
jgi:hypothetical protein